MAEKLANPGVIGETYQDRKHPDRLGVLESRNEKFKTLMFRDKEGNTFNIQYSTFRSQWRKYQGDEVLQTSSQKEAEAQKKEIEVAQAKEAVKSPKKSKESNVDRRKPSLSKDEIDKLKNDIALIVESTTEEYKELFSYDIAKDKRRNRVMFGKEIVFTVWTQIAKGNLGKVRFYMSKEAFKEAVFSKAVGDINAKIIVSDDPKEKRPVSFFLPTDLLEQAMKDLLKSLSPIYANKVKSAKKEEKEKK